MTLSPPRPKLGLARLGRRRADLAPTPAPSTAPKTDKSRGAGGSVGLGGSMGPRGWRGAGGGAWNVLPVPPSYRGTSVQVCGLWPFSGGSGRPVVGVPVGHDLTTGTTVCCDPINFFRHGLISSPSMLVLGLQGLGKSSWTVRQILGLADQGVTPLVLGDMKAEYVQVIRAIGGSVIRVGDTERINVLDPGAMGDAADRIGGEAGDVLREQAIDRSVTLVTALVQIVRRQPLEDWENTLVTRGIRQLVTAHRAAGQLPPTLPDLARLMVNPDDQMIRAALAGDRAEFLSSTKRLARSLEALLDGAIGRTFSGQTTNRIDLDAPGVVVDVSAIRRHSDDVKAAIMLATWSEGYASVEAANALAEAGKAPQKHYLMVMDEMWEMLRIEGAGLVDKLDGLTRLNRNDGVGNIFITHSLKDMESMTSAADARKARGFAERSSIVVTAGLAMDDLRALSEVKRMSEVEMRTVASWSTPAGWKQPMIRDPLTGITRPAPPPGAGKVLIKVGERAGIQTQVKLTGAELAMHDTNTRWIAGAHFSSPAPETLGP
ncbi:ATP/GTP-binding protein [Solicola sp. PLA-1-18]|uniref:ATP/GTP-binding protein n=1 Tax=Solicola sp. PLA-1-18 TaxID=3380532 RepID=UPI003B7B6912